MKNPWLKFYPSDWRADPALRMCSIAARGLWMEMLCLMHDAVPQGSLVVNGRSVTDKQLAALSGAPLSTVQSALAELDAAGVFSREDDGTVYSRRMRRDIAKAEQDRERGLRGGNPNLKRGVNPPDKGKDKAQKPDARSQMPEADAASAACSAGEFTGTSDGELRGWLGPLVGSAPLLVDPDLTPIRRMLDEPGITRADVEAGTLSAVRLSRKPLRSWANLEGWIRRAAADRLAANHQPPAAGQGPPRREPKPKIGFELALEHMGDLSERPR